MPSLLLLALVAADGGHRHSHGRRGRNRSGRQRSRGGRQNSGAENEAVPGGVDFSDCETQDDGMCCVMREEEITTLKKDPILECTHKNVEKCHYTYVTEFTPVQEEVCEENFEKKCQITFKQMAVTETVKKCYRPLMKTCGNEANPSRLRVKRQLAEYGDANDSGSLADANNEQCKTFYETACTTKYVEKQPGKFVGDTSCEKLPIELCGEGCRVEEGEEECHDKEIDTLIDVPEEVSSLSLFTAAQKVLRLLAACSASLISLIRNDPLEINLENQIIQSTSSSRLVRDAWNDLFFFSRSVTWTLKRLANSKPNWFPN